MIVLFVGLTPDVGYVLPGRSQSILAEWTTVTIASSTTEHSETDLLKIVSSTIVWAWVIVDTKEYGSYLR